MSVDGLLVIIPCGSSKIWDRDPERGATPARIAYTGPPFKVNRQYAEHFGQSWVIHSAKYGFISPDWKLPGPYEVTFKKKSTAPVSIDTLRRQIQEQKLTAFSDIIGLGGREYREAISQAFDGTERRPQFPFAGLGIGVGMQRIKKAIAANHVFDTDAPAVVGD